MYIPTFYFLRNNYSENELQVLTEELEECGVRVVVLESGKEHTSLTDTFLEAVKNHI